MHWCNNDILVVVVYKHSFLFTVSQQEGQCSCEIMTVGAANMSTSFFQIKFFKERKAPRSSCSMPCRQMEQETLLQKNRGHHVCKKNNYVILTASAIKGSPARLNEVPINWVSLPHVAAAHAFHFRVRGDSAVVNHQSIAQSWWLMLIDDIHPPHPHSPALSAINSQGVR